MRDQHGVNRGRANSKMNNVTFSGTRGLAYVQFYKDKVHRALKLSRTGCYDKDQTRL